MRDYFSGGVIVNKLTVPQEGTNTKLPEPAAN